MVFNAPTEGFRGLLVDVTVLKRIHSFPVLQTMNIYLPYHPSYSIYGHYYYFSMQLLKSLIIISVIGRQKNNLCIMSHKFVSNYVGVVSFLSRQVLSKQVTKQESKHGDHDDS